MWKTILFLKTRSIYTLLVCILMFSYSCYKGKIFSNQDKDTLDLKKVARAGTVILYERDVVKEQNAETKDDSLILRERFINNWIHQQLLLQTAKLNLTEEEQDIEDLVNEYKTSLLINQYKQKYLREHLDTIVTPEDIKLYIEEFSDDFILKEPLFQYYLAKVASKNKRDILFIYKLFKRKQINLMQDFNLASSTVIQNNDTGWHSAQELLKSLPEELTAKDLQKLKVRKIFIVTSKNKEYTYLLLPLKIMRAGKMSPQEYISDKVKDIILHNRKLALAKQLEYEIYEDAKKKNEFEVY